MRITKTLKVEGKLNIIETIMAIIKKTK